MAFKKRKKNNLRVAGASIDKPNSPNEQIATSLRALIDEFNRRGSEEDNVLLYQIPNNSSIHEDEINMLEGCLQMKTKIALDIFVPLHKVFCVPSDMLLDEQNVARIYGSAYSRIPVYETREDKNDKTGIRGIFMTRQLIMVKPNKEMSVSSLRMHVPFCISPKMNLVDLVNLFQKGRGGKGGHMALVCSRPDLGNRALDSNEAIPKDAGLIGYVYEWPCLKANLLCLIHSMMILFV